MNLRMKTLRVRLAVDVLIQGHPDHPEHGLFVHDSLENIDGVR